MNSSCRWTVWTVFSLLSVLGCGDNAAPTPDKEAKIRSALAKLDPEDQELARQQKFCAIESQNRLGAMGKPVKLTIKDQPVFLCCKGCAKEAEAHPDRTLAKVKELTDAHGAQSQ